MLHRILAWRAWLIPTAAAILGAALSLGPAAPVQGQPAPPSLPDPVPVALDPATTAYLVLDINSAVCPSRPACVASVPAISQLLQQARDAGVFVAYSTTAGAQVLPDVAPQPDDPVVTSRADKFFNTDLDQTLEEHAIQTLVVVGAAATLSRTDLITFGSPAG